MYQNPLNSAQATPPLRILHSFEDTPPAPPPCALFFVRCTFCHWRLSLLLLLRFVNDRKMPDLTLGPLNTWAPLKMAKPRRRHKVDGPTVCCSGIIMLTNKH